MIFLCDGESASHHLDACSFNHCNTRLACAGFSRFKSRPAKCLLGNRASIAIFPHTVRGPCPKTALVLFRYTEPRLACLNACQN